MDHHHQLDLVSGMIIPEYIVTVGEERYLFRGHLSACGVPIIPAKGDVIVIPGWGPFIVDNIIWDYTDKRSLIGVYLTQKKVMVDLEKLFREAQEAMRNYHSSVEKTSDDS